MPDYNEIPPELHDQLPSAFDLALIKQGSFLMGTSSRQVQSLLKTEEWAEEWLDRGLFQVEQPHHTIELPTYAISRSPVTNMEYQEFILDTNHRVPRNWVGFSFPEDMGSHPVTEISLMDAAEYCRWISHKTGNSYRLPTEAEWERAARGDQSRMFPWGEEFDPWRCNTKESGKSGTTPVLDFSPGGDSPWGVTDMAGNVMEWTSSTMQPYPFKHIPSESGQNKIVVRGGSWYYSRRLARCASRETVLASLTSPVLGFRIVRSS